jgi:uncharacterized protein (TIGR02588 family)
MMANRNWLERCVFFLSALLVAGVLGFVVWDIVTSEATPPDLLITVGTPMRGANGWRVPVLVSNEGGKTAEQVRVAVVWRPGGEVREQAEFNLDYVPRHSRRKGWVTFASEPAAADLDVRSLGYADP